MTCDACDQDIGHDENPEVAIIITTKYPSVDTFTGLRLCIGCWKKTLTWAFDALCPGQKTTEFARMFWTVVQGKPVIICPHCDQFVDGLVNGICARCHERHLRDPGFVHQFTPGEHSMSDKCVCGKDASDSIHKHH